jgi:hypothetical protein
MTSSDRKFAFVIDGEVAFVLTPPTSAADDKYERMVAAFSSDPKVIEIPLDEENRDVIGADWFYTDGQFVSKFQFNPNIAPPQGT